MQDDISILMVDDSKLNCAMIERTLHEGGYHNVRTARSAHNALEMMQQQPADILITDWMMPEMDGLELTDKIREHDEARHHYTYILLLTGKEGIEPLIEAFKRGADDYLTKPPNKFELLARTYAASRISGLQNTLLESSKVLTRMNQALKGKMQTDPISGFSNLSTISKRINNLLKAAESRGGVLCLAYLRITNYAELTAEVSQRVKDEITISISRRLQHTARPSDEIARISEHDYLIVMYHSNKKTFQRYSLQRISNVLNLRPMSTSAGFMNLKAKIKVACTDNIPAQCTAQELIEQAEEKFNE